MAAFYAGMGMCTWCGEWMSAHIPRNSVTVFPLPSTQHSLNKGPQLRLLDFCSQEPALIYSLHLLVIHLCCVTNYPNVLCLQAINSQLMIQFFWVKNPGTVSWVLCLGVSQGVIKMQGFHSSQGSNCGGEGGGIYFQVCPWGHWWDSVLH